jgi:rod shape determining protein RodA
VLIGCVGLGVMFLAGVNLAYFVGGAAATAAALPFVWSQLHEYQRDRILIFLDPESDMLGKGYQITQSKIALGSGGFAGKGFLQGTQSQLDFVPEKHTDFIFTMFAEEMGFLGCMLLIMLYGVLIWTLVVMALRCRSVFGRLVIMGLAAMLSLHVFINIAMTAGAVPVVGVPLPLMSYGGSSLFATMIGLGLAMNAFVNRAYTLTSRDSATQFGR